MSVLPRLTAVIALLALVGSGATGCKPTKDDEMVRPTVTVTVPPLPPKVIPNLPVGKATVGADTIIWARDNEFHVGSRTIDVKPLRVDAFVVVRGGIFFLNDRELWFTDLRKAKPTPYTDVGQLAVTPDRRQLGFVDRGHGPKDSQGTPLAAAMVFDTVSGKSLLASYVGMGDVSAGGLAKLYHDKDPRALGFYQGSLVVQGVDRYQRYPLDLTTPFGVDELPPIYQPNGRRVGYRIQAGKYAVAQLGSTADDTATLAPGGRFAVVEFPRSTMTAFRPDSGKRVAVTGAPQSFVPRIWRGGDTIVGTGVKASGDPEGIWVCHLVTASCAEQVSSTDVGNGPVVFGTGAATVFN